jgi:ribonuclease D
MDRATEKRLSALKDWRGPRSEALKLDPGVLCPNAALEAIAWTSPRNAEDMKGIPELKNWLVREFADEILGVLERHDSAAKISADEAVNEKSEADDGESAPTRSGRRRSRGRAKSSSQSKAKPKAKSSPKTSPKASARLTASKVPNTDS